MKWILFLLCITIIIATSCKNKNNKTDDAKLDTVARFPIIDLLQNDFDEVVKIPYYIYCKNYNLTTKKLIDSVAMSRDELKKIVATILQTDITSPKGKLNFKESNFEDAGLNSISVVVAANDTNQVVQGITAMYNDERHVLKNATITLNSKAKDTLITQKLYWKIGKSILIATEKKLDSTIISETKSFINWNDKESK